MLRPQFKAGGPGATPFVPPRSWLPRVPCLWAPGRPRHSPGLLLVLQVLRNGPSRRAAVHQIARSRRVQMLQPVITTKGEKVKITRAFVTDQPLRRWWKAYNKPESMWKENRKASAKALAIPGGGGRWNPRSQRRDPSASSGQALGHPLFVVGQTWASVFCYPGCPNARHPGQPSFVGELALLPPAPGPPA